MMGFANLQTGNLKSDIKWTFLMMGDRSLQSSGVLELISSHGDADLSALSAFSLGHMRIWSPDGLLRILRGRTKGIRNLVCLGDKSETKAILSISAGFPGLLTYVTRVLRVSCWCVWHHSSSLIPDILHTSGSHIQSSKKSSLSCLALLDVLEKVFFGFFCPWTSAVSSQATSILTIWPRTWTFCESSHQKHDDDDGLDLLLCCSSSSVWLNLSPYMEMLESISVTYSLSGSAKVTGSRGKRLVDSLDRSVQSV